MGVEINATAVNRRKSNMNREKVSQTFVMVTEIIVAQALLFPSAMKAASGTLIDLGLLHGISSYGFGISDSGRVSGHSAGGYYAFRTAVHHELTSHSDAGECVHDYLTNVISGGVTASIAYDIYQSGTAPLRVVGDCLPTSGHWQAYAYHEDPSTTPPARTARLLSEPSGASESSARAVISAGTGLSHVAGYATVTNRSYACYWFVNHEGSVQFTNLGSLYLGSHTNSYALDTDGTRHVGYYNEGSESSDAPFLISGTNVYVLNAYTPSAALGISSSGLIAGYYVSNSITKPTFWRIIDGTMHASYLSLGSYTHGMARAVSNDGVLVGSLWNSATDEVACRWLTNGTVQTLNDIAGDIDWNMTRANNINSAAGKDTTGIMKNVNTGEVRAFMFYGW